LFLLDVWWVMTLLLMVVLPWIASCLHANLMRLQQQLPCGGERWTAVLTRASWPPRFWKLHDHGPWQSSLSLAPCSWIVSVAADGVVTESRPCKNAPLAGSRREAPYARCAKRSSSRRNASTRSSRPSAVTRCNTRVARGRAGMWIKGAAIDVRRVAFMTALRLISCTLEEDDLENGDTRTVSKVNGSGRNQ
jgi:hypothetical protein